MGTPEAEIDEHLARSGEHHACRLGRDQRLKMHDVDKARFDKLRLGERCRHAQDRLIGEEDRALRKGVDIAGKAEIGEIRESACA